MKLCGSVSQCIVIMFIIFIMGGCGTQPNSSPSNQSVAYTVTDAQGTVVQFPEKPQRILTLSMGTDEIMLGLVPPNRLAGVNSLLDDPEDSNVVELARQIAVKITDPSVESIVSLQPDLVIVPDWGNLEQVAPLRDLGIRVVVCKGVHNIADIKETIQLLAAAVGEDARGEDVLRQMDDKMADIDGKIKSMAQKTPQRVVLISLMNTYGGAGSTFDDACRYAGVINGLAAAGVHDGQPMSKEMLLKINPDVILLPSYHNHGQFNSGDFQQSFTNDPALQTLQAVRSGRLVQTRDCYIYNGSQDVVFAIQEIAFAVYGPEFSQPDNCHITAVPDGR